MRRAPRSRLGTTSQPRRVYELGYNGNGVLGVGDSTQGSLPDPTAVDLGAGRRAEVVSIGGHACALLDDGSVKCWGGNNLQLGLGAATTYLVCTCSTIGGVAATVSLPAHAT
jgi:alpha-tubulin suppressor-like RCC1 family protein